MTPLAIDMTEIEPLVGGVPQRFLVLFSEGLRGFGQDELAFGFRPGQIDPSETANNLYGALVALGQQAQGGQPAVPYGFTAFGPNSPSLIPGADFRGLLYLPGEIPGLPRPARYLPAIALPARDAVLAQETSFLRVAARLGNLERYYPFPFWTDLSRPSVAMDGDHDSVLRRLPRLALPDFSTTKTASGYRIVVSRAAGRRLKEILRVQNPSRTPAPLALLSSVNPDWQAMMVWEPGQDEPTAISDGPNASSEEVGLHFAIAVPEQEASSAILMEDGVGLLLSNADWVGLINALLKRKGRLQLDDGTDILVVRG